MVKIAISLGDLNGIGAEIALKAHSEISKFCKPIYCINKSLLSNAAKLLKTDIPQDISLIECGSEFEIKPAKISKKSGKFSFISFQNALLALKTQKADAIVTLPINKQAWSKAKVPFVGHTDALSKIYKKRGIMMLGCNDLFVALFSDHVALKAVSKLIKTKRVYEFLLDLYKSTKFEKIGVLGFNPHASDYGVMGGKEEKQIAKAIKLANSKLKKEIFAGPLVPDAAFSATSLKSCNRLVAMYHDQGLIPLKALFFDKSFNVSLNLPIIRTSVDHGTAFDIAYKGVADVSSYIQAVKFATMLVKDEHKQTKEQNIVKAEKTIQKIKVQKENQTKQTTKRPSKQTQKRAPKQSSSPKPAPSRQLGGVLAKNKVVAKTTLPTNKSKKADQI